jgi:nicotinate dehydrogenase subunit B
MKDFLQEDFLKVNRRSFLKRAGQLCIGFSLFPVAGCKTLGIGGDQTKAEDSVSESVSENPEISSWLWIDSLEQRLTVLTGKIELGQDIQTSLRQIAAEELDVDMQRVSIIMADTGQTPDERYTAGSASIENSGAAIRNAAAEARMQLFKMAEERLGLPAEQLMVRDGTIQGPGPEPKAITYWQLLEGRQLEGRVSGNAPLKNPNQYTLVGTDQPRTDLVAMATGAELYVHDMRMAGMVHARVLRPPGYNAELTSLPEAKIRAMPEVIRLVRNGNFVGVVAKNEWGAVKALRILQEESTWEQQPMQPAQASLYQEMPSLVTEKEVVKDSDQLDSAMQGAAIQVEATYTKPYQMHGSIGPSCAVALWDNNILTVWSHTQGVYPLRRSLAAMLDIDEDAIRVIGVIGSGCYGHNGADDVAADAALLATATPGRHVRVQWMREDEHAWEPYGSAMLFRLKAGVDQQGNITAWQTELWSDQHSTRPSGRAGQLLPARHLARAHELPSGGFMGGAYRNAEPLYALPNLRIVAHAFKGPLRTSALRSLGAYGNVFALESFMDELATKASQDPVEFRLKHLQDERAKDVIRAAARQSGWGGTLPAGRGMGIAFAQYKNSAAYCAVVAEVEYNAARNELRILQMIGAIDAGQTINPDGLKNQTEGGMIQAASWTMKEQVTYVDSRITSRNWESYPIFRFSEVPYAEVVIVNRPHEKPLGAGEAAQGPAAAAIANAVFDAIGIRVRDLPITPAKLRG